MDLSLTGNNAFFKDLNNLQQKSKTPLNLSVLRKLDNGMYLINLRGDNYKIRLPENTQIGDYKAIIENKEGGAKAFKLIPVKMAEPNLTRNVPLDSNVKLGSEIDIKLIKMIKNGLFLVDFKGKMLEAKIPDTPATKLFKAIVMKTEPILELKPILTPLDKLNANELKTELIHFDKNVIIKTLKSSGKFNIDQITPASIEKVIKESGIFFENKLLNDIKVIDDNKLHALRTDNSDLKESIQKIQLFNSILNDSAFSFFSLNNLGIKDGEIFISRNKDQFSVNIKVDFSKIGETFIRIVIRENIIDIVVSSEKDISQELSNIHIPSINIHWKKINEKEKEAFDLSSIIMEKLGRFEVIA